MIADFPSLQLPTFYATISTLRIRGDDTYAAIPSVNFSRDGVSLGPSTANEPSESGCVLPWHIRV